MKSLAVQTAKATGDIARHIEAVQASSNGAIEVVHGIQERMREISTRTSSAAASVLQQNAATFEITRNASNAARERARSWRSSARSPMRQWERARRRKPS